MERFLPVSYAVVFLWGLAVIFGFVGLGRLVARLAGGEAAATAGWGCHAVWGMALYVFAGGLLALCGLCTAIGITVLICAGLANFFWTTTRGPRPTRATFAALPWSTWPVFAVLALVYAGGLCWQLNINESDDLPAYYNFCEKLLSTGSFDEPFSWRRLASLGGHTLLQCSMLAQTSWINVQSFEVSLCPVILVGLVLGFRGGALARSPLGIFLGLLAVTTPIIRVNTASHYTGLVLLVGLFVTLDLAERSADRRQRLLVVAGLVAAALCSLRAQNIPAAGGALGLFWLASWIKDRPAPRVAIAEALAWGCSLFLALLPWMIMSYLSNGSPLFPLFQGGNNAEFMSQPLDRPPLVQLATPVQMLFHPALLPLLLCLLALPGWRKSVAAPSICVAAVFASLALAYRIPYAPDDTTIPRYVQPLLVAGALAALMAAAVSARGRLMAWGLAALVVAASLTERSQDLLNHYGQLANANRLIMPFHAQDIANHRDAQSLVPAGKRILVCSDYPFAFDHRRNPLWIIDLPHGANPAPGLPYQQPPEETKRYLRKLGIEYLIYVDFNNAGWLYNRHLRERQAAGNVPMLKTQAPFMLDFYSTVEGLAASETNLGKAGNLTVVQFKP